MQSNGIAQYFKRFPSCEAAKRGFAAPRMSAKSAADLDSPRSGSDAESEPAGTPRATSPDEVGLYIGSPPDQALGLQYLCCLISLTVMIAGQCAWTTTRWLPPHLSGAVAHNAGNCCQQIGARLCIGRGHPQLLLAPEAHVLTWMPIFAERGGARDARAESSASRHELQLAAGRPRH